MLDISYPLFGGVALLTIMCTGCIWARLSQLGHRLAAVEQRPLLPVLQMPAQTQPALSLDPQHTEVYIPPLPQRPGPSAPPAILPHYYDNQARTAVI